MTLIPLLLSACTLAPFPYRDADGVVTAADPEVRLTKIEDCGCPTAPVIGRDRLGNRLYVHRRVTLAGGTSFMVDDIYRVDIVVDREEAATPSPRMGREGKP